MEWYFSLVSSEGEEDEQHDYEPREKFEVAEARDVFGESDEEEDQEVEREPEQEVEDRHSPGESLQGSPEVCVILPHLYFYVCRSNL